MKLSVTSNYVDLDFGTVVPVKLGQKFATESIAQSAAFMIACTVGINEYTVYESATGVTQKVTLKKQAKARAKAARERTKRHGS